MYICIYRILVILKTKMHSFTCVISKKNIQRELSFAFYIRQHTQRWRTYRAVCRKTSCWQLFSVIFTFSTGTNISIFLYTQWEIKWVIPNRYLSALTLLSVNCYIFITIILTVLNFYLISFHDLGYKRKLSWRENIRCDECLLRDFWFIL